MSEVNGFGHIAALLAPSPSSQLLALLGVRAAEGTCWGRQTARVLSATCVVVRCYSSPSLRYSLLSGALVGKVTTAARQQSGMG